jgi:hypothetical protein
MKLEIDKLNGELFVDTKTYSEYIYRNNYVTTLWKNKINILKRK